MQCIVEALFIIIFMPLLMSVSKVLKSDGCIFIMNDSFVSKLFFYVGIIIPILDGNPSVIFISY